MSAPFDWTEHDLTSEAGARAWVDDLKDRITHVFRDKGQWLHEAIVLEKRDPKTRLRYKKVRPFSIFLTGDDALDRDTEQDALADLIKRHAKKTDAVGVAITCEAWTLRKHGSPAEDDAMIRDYERNWIGRMAKHPRAVEIIQVTVHHRSLGAGLLMAEIHRDGAVAVLGPWKESWATEPDDHAEGRWSDLLPRSDG